MIVPSSPIPPKANWHRSLIAACKSLFWSSALSIICTLAVLSFSWTLLAFVACIVLIFTKTVR